MAYSDIIDTSLPDGSDDPAEADNNIRRIQGGFQEILAVEHNVDLTGTIITGDGKHTDITTLSIVNAGAFANTGNFTLNTNKFTIDAATGNVVVAGTLDVAGAAEITGVATLGDASLLKTSAAPSTDAMIANKKYVDDKVGSANYTPTSYAGEESITFPNGLIMKQGLKTLDGNTTTVTFAAAFPTACTRVIVTPSITGGDPSNNANAHTFAAATFKIYLFGGSGQTINWFAIGY